MNSGPQVQRTPLAIDRDRVTCLLLINTQLMKKAINIYSNILVNQPAIARLSQQDRKRVLDQYQNYTRRLHCNLQVLTFIHEKYHVDNPAQKTSKTPFPILVQAPSDMPELNNLYNKLQELYPEAVQFIKAKVQQMKSDQTSGGTRPSSIPSQRSSIANSPMVNNMMPNQIQRQPSQKPQQLPPQMSHQMNQQMPQMSQQMMGQQIPQQMPQQMPQMGQQSNQMSQQVPMQQMNQLAQGSPSQSSPANQFTNQYKNVSMNNMNFMPQNPQQSAEQQQQQVAPQSISPQQLYQSINPGSPGNMLDFFN